MSAAKKAVETLTMTEAQQQLGVARNTLWRIIKKYNIPTFNDVLDSRVKRVRLADIQHVLEEAERVRRGIAA
jgi:predicted DNA-binding transcriptional regulator AlpA